MTFRYWIDSKGKRTLEQPGLVDVKRVRDELGEAHELLSWGLGSWLQENRNNATDLLLVDGSSPWGACPSPLLYDPRAETV